VSYIALYRQYRPRFFHELVGQEHIAATLRYAVVSERVNHAYLFCGPRGTGKTSAAHILSRAVNCLTPEGGEPCGHCLACARILEDASLDIMEIDAASNRGIEEIRDLRERVRYAPAQEKYKVYIIDEVHMLTTEAFNALLKTLEEPPERVIFILATTEPHKVPVTVLSRCQRFDFHRIGEQPIVERLQHIAHNEGRAVTPEALALIAARSEGGLRDAIGLLDHCLVYAPDEVTAATVNEVLGVADEKTVMAMTEAMARGDALAILEGVSALNEAGHDLRQFLQQLLAYIREQLLAVLSGQKARLTQKEALALLRDLADYDQKLRYSLLPRVTLEVALLNAAHLKTEEDTSVTAKQVKVEQPAGEPVGTPNTPGHAACQTEEAVPASGAPAELSCWPEVLQRVRRKSVGAYGFLREARPQQLSGDVLTVVYPAKFHLHRERLLAEYRELVEEAAGAVFKRPVHLEAIISK